ncbi:MAG TPA: hypothetical protein VFJ43_11745 [Bacteroidia bacterium]|nr:hypothetical protein [Bacteroidia bacterium]
MRSVFLSLTILLLFSCNENRDPAYKVDSLEEKSKAVVMQTPEQTVKNFLIWYKTNYKKISGIEMVNNNPPVDDTLLWYSVNFPATEKWLQLFKESGYVSDEFVTHWRKYFKDCEKDFQKNHAWDGPPDGFDYDFIFNSQEEFPSDSVIQNATTKSANLTGDRVTISLEIPDFGELTKKLVKSTDGKWLLTE